jgi:hypothetical protein
LRRIQIVTVVALILAALIFAYSQAPLPSPQKGQATTPRRIQVNSQTITALPSGRKYVVDLTKRGVKYEFDPKAGQIDFSRVMVRTDRGEVTIGSFLGTLIPKDKVAAFRYTSQSFRLGTQPTRTLPSPRTNTTNFDCNPKSCLCQGESDCQDMFDTIDCSAFFCTPEPLCICKRGQW